jgi:hypothetical protein
MRTSEIERLLAHLESVEQKHPVATVVDGNGMTYAGDLASFGLHEVVVCDPVSKRSAQIHLPAARSIRVIALGQPPATFGDTMTDDETVTP